MTIVVQGTRRECWVGFSALGDQPGEGVERLDLDHPAGGWTPVGTGWRGGSCTALAVHRGRALAGTHHAGLLWLPLSREAQWTAPVIGCGLPIRDDSERLYPITDLAVDAVHGSDRLMIGTRQGVFTPSDDTADGRFHSIGSAELDEQVTIPPDWIFCSGAHRIAVAVDGHG